MSAEVPNTLATVNVRRLGDGMYTLAIVCDGRLRDIGPYSSLDVAFFNAARVLASELRDRVWRK